MKSFPGSGRAFLQSATPGSSAVEEEQDLRLERIGILELVDEDMFEALLELVSHPGIVLQEIAGAHQKIEKVEQTSSLLQRLVALHQPLELVLKMGGEVGARLLVELGDVPKQEISLLDEVFPGNPIRVRAPALAALQLHRGEPTLESVVVAASADLFLSLQVLGKRDEIGEVHVEVVAGALGPGGLLRELHRALDEGIDGVLAIERTDLPGSGEVAELDKRPSGAIELVDRPFVVPCLPPDETPHSRRRIPEGLLEPTVEDSTVDTFGLILGRDLEQRVDACLERTLSEEVGAESMDGADVRLFELGEAALEPRRHLVVARGAARAADFLELSPEPELQLTCRFLGEGDGGETRELAPAAAHHFDDAAHERRRLSRSRRRLDDECRVELLADRPSGGLVGERVRHVRFRSQLSGDSRGSFSLRRASICILGPQTGR